MTKNPTEVLANINKCMEHLRRQEKISMEFLYSEGSIMEGDSDVIWGLLNDMWRFYSGKETRKRQPASVRTRKNLSPSPISKSQDNIQESVKKSDLSYLRNMGVKCSVVELKTIEDSVVSWLKSLGVIQMTSNVTLLDIEKEVINGSLLCKLAGVLGNFDTFRMNANPKTRMAIYSNIRNALEAFRKLPALNRRYLWSERELYAGEHKVILGLLEDLRTYYNTKMKRPSICKDNTPLNFQEEFASATVPPPDPYSMTNQIKPNTLLPDVLTSWVRKVLTPILKIKGSLTVDKFRDGVLLARLIEVLERKNIEGIEARPKTSAASLHNIRKALDSLKSKKNISLEYIYADKEVYQGNSEVIVELLKSIKCAYHTTQRDCTNVSASSVKAFGRANNFKKQQGNSFFL